MTVKKHYYECVCDPNTNGVAWDKRTITSQFNFYMADVCKSCLSVGRGVAFPTECTAPHFLVVTLHHWLMFQLNKNSVSVRLV
jgi:hypothetical protein